MNAPQALDRAAAGRRYRRAAASFVTIAFTIVLNLDPNLTAEDARAAAAEYSEDEARALLYDWETWARPEQIWPSGDWRTWLLLGGRGSGKTRPGAEAVRKFADANPGAIIALVGPTSSDCRRDSMSPSV